MVEKSLEEKLRKNATSGNIHNWRIIGVGAGYYYLGLQSPHPEVVGPLCGAIGLGISWYDEFADKKLNLTIPALMTVTGGLIGYNLGNTLKELFVDSLNLNPNSNLSEIISSVPTYLGATIGGGLSLINPERRS